MGWHLSLADLQTSGSGFKTTIEIGVLKAGTPGSSTASSALRWCWVSSQLGP